MPRHFLMTTTLLFALTIGMSMYVWQTRRHELNAPRVRNEAKIEHVAPPPSGAMERVTIFVADDRSGDLRPQSIPVPLASGRQQRAEGLLHALISIYTGKNAPHELAAGANVRDVFLVDPGLAVIDVNSAFVDGQVSGVLSEELTITSMTQTLAVNVPGLTRVKILVDGKDRETLAGHADLTGFFDVAQIGDLAKELPAH